MSKLVSNIIIYGKSYCPYCVKAKAFFDDRGISYDYFDVGADATKYEEMLKNAGPDVRTVPQIIINGQAIGGYDNLVELNDSGALDRLLNLTEE